MWESQAAFWPDFPKPRWEATGLVAFLGGQESEMSAQRIDRIAQLCDVTGLNRRLSHYQRIVVQSHATDTRSNFGMHRRQSSFHWDQ